VLAEVQGLSVVLGIEAAQCRFRRGCAIGRWRGVTDDVIPEQPLQVDQPSNQRLVAFDAMDLQMLATEQHRHISRLLAGDGELVHDLQLHILGHALFPEACPVYAGSLAFEDLHIVGADHLAVDVGQHPGQLGSGCCSTALIRRTLPLRLL
jgi:hypothetical protein